MHRFFQSAMQMVAITSPPGLAQAKIGQRQGGADRTQCEAATHESRRSVWRGFGVGPFGRAVGKRADTCTLPGARAQVAGRLQLARARCAASSAVNRRPCFIRRSSSLGWTVARRASSNWLRARSSLNWRT